MPRRPIPPAPIKPLSEAPEERDFSRPAQRLPASGKGPPLFIKIEKYNDVVNHLNSLKGYALSLRDALDALADIEKELQHGISITHRALDKFNATISSIDARITRVAPRDADAPKLNADEMEEYVHQLHDQMEKIRNDLKNAQF